MNPTPPRADLAGPPTARPPREAGGAPGEPANRWVATDPLTRLIVAVGTLVAAVLLDSALCLLLLAVVAVVLPAALARTLPRVLGLGLTLALPLAVSVIVVNVLFAVEGEVVVTLGPLEVTREGIELATTVTLRVLTMSAAVVLFYLTTPPARLVASLQHHGVPARLTFVVHNTVSMIPLLAERAREVSEAQRARGLDSEGRPWRRARGVLALASPTVLGAVEEVEARTLALETRGFVRRGRPTLLWPPADSAGQRVLRWGIAVALLALLLARLAGVGLPC
jgi:energy-coupling factor transport system permease protein